MNKGFAIMKIFLGRKGMYYSADSIKSRGKITLVRMQNKMVNYGRVLINCEYSYDIL